MGLIKVAEISIEKLEDRKTVTAILHENGYTVGPGKRKKTETGKQLDYYLKVYVERKGCVYQDIGPQQSVGREQETGRPGRKTGS